jgi:Fe-Mn family superoxide dismutase
MKVTVKHIDSGLSSEDKKMYNDFIKFLNKHYSVNNPLTILFLGKKTGNMSTGSQNMNGEIKVLSKNRLNRDIMRTLAHEWVHAHQRLVLGRERGPDIGGQNEDEANAFAGRLIKMFEKDYPHYNGLVFEGVESIVKKVELLNEQIILTEKENLKNDLILEMKKIGIEKLPYSYSALNKFVDSKTMNIHYNKHYKGYVKKLNDALKDKNKKFIDLEDIIKSINKYDTKVRNNAGGAFNHALFWKMLSPKKQTPKGEVFEKITKQYGNIKKMKDEFNEIAKERFGSGWVWLVLTKSNKLKIMSTPNQDNPLMNVVDGGYPLLGLDLWEHAYYLKYQNKRDEYIKNFWNYINWEFINDLYLSKSKKIIKESYIKVLLENEETGKDVKKLMSRELQKIRLIPLDAEAAESAISNIITAEIERGSLNFNRTIEGLMTLDLSGISERSKYRFDNYFQRFVKSRTRGFDFEALIAGLLGGQLATSLNSPYDVFTVNGDKISCKIIRNTKEKINLKSIKKSVSSYILNYNGSIENKEELIRLSQFPNFLELILRHENQDIRNCAEDILTKLLEEITGMLIGIPYGSENKINLYFFDKSKLIQLAKIPELLSAPKTKGSQTITFSPKVLDYKSTMTGSIQFPMLSQDEYISFLSNTPETTKIVDLMNSFGVKYGVNRLGDNIPQDIIRQLSKNERFKLDLGRIVGVK